ncbi:hypothetical protein M1P56_29970 [Streptomyces sp. HU2014]|uniref:hypothetical protein n=1 Tax=Streptomyces sp. HU2014 TaxID=2939414 RepID=UPI00200F5871|nr:hypothetical protein [Streptomyces sp. HU2014]UQI48244.1 hypothetical protein M1P56_29970 [Streptomyces sp. HU2014]
MDENKLKQLVRKAVSQGRCNEAVLESINMPFTVDSGTTSTASLLHMYSRRLRRTNDDARLSRQTEDLVSFLRAYPEEHLAMVSFRTQDGGFHLFLADAEETTALFWMEMFDSFPIRPPKTQQPGRD